MRDGVVFDEVEWDRGERPSWWTSEVVVWLFKLPNGRGFFTSDLDEACERLLGEPHLRDVDAVRRSLWSMGYAVDEWARLGASPVQVKKKLVWDFLSTYHDHARSLQAWSDHARSEAERVLVQVGQHTAQRIGSLAGRDVPQEVRDFFDTKPDRYTGKPTNGKLTARQFRQLARKHNAYELEAMCQRLVSEEEEAAAAARQERADLRHAREEAARLDKAVWRMRDYFAQDDFNPRNSAEQLGVLLLLQMRGTEDPDEQQRLSDQLTDFIISDILQHPHEQVDYQQTIGALQNLLR